MSDSDFKNALWSQNEQSRQAALAKLCASEAGHDSRLVDLSRLAAHICNTTMAGVSLVERNVQQFRAKVGIESSGSRRELSFCDYAIKGSDAFIVEDALEYIRFLENPLVVGDPKVRFYAGALLKTADGYNVGTLCVFDRKPKSLSLSQVASLNALARQAVFILEQSKNSLPIEQSDDSIIDLVNQLPDLVFTVDSKLQFQFSNRSFELFFKTRESEVLGKDISAVFNSESCSDSNSSSFLEMKPYFELAKAGERQIFQMHLTRPMKKSTLSIGKPGLFKVLLFPFQRIGQEMGFHCTLTDITQINDLAVRATEQSERVVNVIVVARENEKVLGAIYESAPLGIVLLASDRKILNGNRFYSNSINKGANLLSGSSILEIIHPDDQVLFKEVFNSALPKGKEVQQVILRLIDCGGEIKSASMNLSSVECNGGQSVLVLFDFNSTNDTLLKNIETDKQCIEVLSKFSALGEMTAGWKIA